MSPLRPLIGSLLFLAIVAAFELHSQPAATPRTIAHIQDPKVGESSGLVASRVNRGLLWTHNDSGDGPNIYAFDRSGAPLGRWSVAKAHADDWEDIALGPGPEPGASYLYLGDIGDNARRKSTLAVYRVREPRLAGGSCMTGCATDAAATLRLRYPDGPHNAEALMVHPVTGDLYIVTKSGPAEAETLVYRATAASLREGSVATLERIATLDLSDPTLVALLGGITGGDISPDGRRVTLCDYMRAYEAVLPRGAAFDEIWKQRFSAVPLPLGLQIEAIAFEPEGSGRLATSEGPNAPLLEIPGSN